MENEEVSLVHLFLVEALDWIVHEETGFKLDLKEAGEEDLLRKPSFLTCAESTSNWAVDTATLLMNYFPVTHYVS